MAQTNSGDKEDLNVSQSQPSSISGQMPTSQSRISSTNPSFSVAMSSTNGSCDNAITSGANQSTATLSADSNSADTSPGASTNKSLPSTSSSVINKTANSLDTPYHNQPWLDGGQTAWDFTSEAVNFPSSFSSEPSGKWGSSTIPNAWESQSLNPPKSKSQAAEWGFSTADNSSAQPQAAWALPTTNNNDELTSWGQPNQLPNTGTDGWGQPTTTSNNPSNNGAQAQWGAAPPTTNSWVAQPPAAKLSESQSSQSSQWETYEKNSSPLTSPSSDITTSKPADAAPTSWAGAAAKGLPKTPIKQPEIDPIQQQIEESINNPEGWGKTPIRQDSSWGTPPEKKNQDDSNTWQAAPNNGTAIWESSKSGEGVTNSKWEDKSAWNQKVVGNNDPNVWNGEGQKGKDNNLWDNIPTSKEVEPPSSDQTSQWNGPAAAVTSRTISQSSGENNTDNGWAAPNGPTRSSPPNNPTNWSSAPPANERQWTAPLPPNRSNSTSDVGGWSEPPMFERQNSGWNQGGGGGGNQGNWLEHQNPGGAGGWGDNPNNQWAGNPPRKPANNYGGNWDDGSENRSRRNLKSESDVNWDDADMGDWNESNSVWSSATGFKRPAMPAGPRHATIPENAMPGQKMNPRMHNNFGAPNPTRSQMIEQLVGMGFNKLEATNALIHTDMNLQAAIAMLYNNNTSYHGDPNSMSGSAFDKFNPNIPPPNLHMMNNNQMKGGMPAHNRRHNMPMHPMAPQGRAPVMPQNQHTKMIVQQLQKAVNVGLIRANILTIPLSDNTLRSITHLLQMYQQYQNLSDQVMQAHRIPGYMSQQKIEASQQNMVSIKTQMNQLQQALLSRNPSNVMRGDGGISDQINNMSMVPGGQGGGLGSSSSQSRLSKWVNDDKAPGSKQNLHSSQSTPNLQAGALGELSPWSNSTIASLNSGWSASPSYLDHSHDTSQIPTTSSNGPQPALEIPEFIPGQPWQGAAGSKLEDDPTMTPGSVARSLSVNTASQSGRGGSDLGWNMNGGRGTWSNDSSSPDAGDSWRQPRPPPGLRGNINRSKSMPQGPSDKNSAFSPITSDWDSPQGSWLVLRNLTPQIDSSTLKTLCRQHGPLQHFFVNQSLGQALVKYQSKAEGQKAQKSLNSCSLSNTTIMAEFVNSNEAQRIIDGMQLQTGRAGSAQPHPASLWSGSSNNSSNNYYNTWGGGPTLVENGMTSSLSPGGYITSEFSM